MLEVVHTCSHTATAKVKKELRNVLMLKTSQKRRGEKIQSMLTANWFTLQHNNKEMKHINVLCYHFKAHDADCFFRMTEAKSSFRKSLLSREEAWVRITVNCHCLHSEILKTPPSAKRITAIVFILLNKYQTVFSLLEGQFSGCIKNTYFSCHLWCH